MGRWELLPGTTLDDAKREGAMWTRATPAGVEMIHLPGHVVSKLGYIPAPAIARLLADLATRVRPA